MNNKLKYTMTLLASISLISCDGGGEDNTSTSNTPVVVTPTDSSGQTTTGTSTTTPSSFNDAVMTADVVAKANAARSANDGGGDLIQTAELQALARQHNIYLAGLTKTNNDLTINHDSFMDRYNTASGFGAFLFSENVGATQGISASAIGDTIVQGWLDSPGHRVNLLTKAYTRSGTDVYYDADTDSVFVTQLYAKYATDQ